MTTVAWDGKTLSADKKANTGGLAFTVTKIYKVNGCLIGVSGDLDRAMEMVEWFRKGSEPEKFPVFGRSNDDWCGLLAIKPDKTIWKYERTPYPFLIENKYFAIGSGRDFAMATMECGGTSKKAIEVASKLDIGTGIGIDSLEFYG